MVSFADSVANVCYSKYRNLPKKGKPIREGEWTLLAGVVIENILTKNLHVASLATGTKCIPTSQLNSQGNQVADSHAEVLARRCFLRYLYQELLKVAGRQQSSALIRQDCDEFYCKLRPELRLHFFTSQTPCGDASIFPKLGDDDVAEGGPEEEGDRSPKRRKIDDQQLDNISHDYDIYRTGAKCVQEGPKDRKGQGKEYHVCGALRTKPGRGAPSLAMSCSDKMARWQHCGLQGALVAYFIREPLQLASVVVGGCPYSEPAMRRALCERIPDGAGRRIIFYHSKQVFEHSRLNVEAASATCCNSSILWSDVTKDPLSVGVNGYRQGVTKKNLDKPGARLPICRKELFHLFLKLKQKINNREMPVTFRRGHG